MTALVSIRCDTERDDGTFCAGSTSTNGVGYGRLTIARWEQAALERGWTTDGVRHYCPTCSAKTRDPRTTHAAPESDGREA